MRYGHLQSQMHCEVCMKKVLVYGIDEQDLSIYKKVLQQHDISVFQITDDDLELTIATLFDRNASTSGACSMDETYMLFDGVSKDELVEIVHQFDHAGKEYDGIKVMRTPVNEKWLLSGLLEETKNEHAVFQKVRLLDNVLRSCNGLDFSKMDQEAEKNVKQAMMDAYLYLQGGQFELETLDAKAKTLMEALRSAEMFIS